MSVAMFRASRENLGNVLKENIFKKTQWESCFVLKVYHLTITNVDLLENSSNHKAMFPEYLKNLPQIYFKNIPKISPEYCKVMTIFL